MTNLDRIDGGYATARVSAAEQDKLAREEREAAALAYLTRNGLDDIAEILGLVEQPKAKGRQRLYGHKAVYR
ncbi:MAG: hypothetical protein WA890_18585 [Micromonospora sp.]